MLIELREFVLVLDEESQTATYHFADSTIHASKKSANQWVAEQISESGMGKSLPTVAGPLPRRLWVWAEVQEVETAIRTGQNLEAELSNTPAVPPNTRGPLLPDDGEED